MPRTTLQTSVRSGPPFTPPQFLTPVLFDRVTGLRCRLKVQDQTLVAVDWADDVIGPAHLLEREFPLNEEPCFTDYNGPPITIRPQVSSLVVSFPTIASTSPYFGTNHGFGFLDAVDSMLVWGIQLQRVAGSVSFLFRPGDWHPYSLLVEQATGQVYQLSFGELLYVEPSFGVGVSGLIVDNYYAQILDGVLSVDQTPIVGAVQVPASFHLSIVDGLLTYTP